MKLLNKNEASSVSGGLKIGNWDASQTWDNTKQSLNDNVFNPIEEAAKNAVKPKVVEKTVIQIVGTDSIYDELRKYDWVHCTNGMTRCTGGWNNGTQFDYNFQP